MLLKILIFTQMVLFSASDADAALEIVATTGMVADIARHVVGEYGTVDALMGEGIDPHLYKPTASDARKIMHADMIFYSGLLLEGRMTDTFLKVARMGKVVFPVTELIEETYLLEPPEFKGHWDPHVWMDVSAWAHAVDAIAKALCEQDPAHCEIYTANAKKYNEQLTRLHQYALDSIATIPKEQRILITAHDAFNYFGRAYGIEVVGIQGLSTESEAGIEDVNRLVRLLVDRGITAVFVESSVSDRNVNALIEGAASKGHKVVIGGRLFSDAMGRGGTYKGTYIGMLDHNITTITRGLGGSAPELGFISINQKEEVVE
jgi:manganese/zinc/iron transport system substrate-binding protein